LAWLERGQLAITSKTAREIGYLTQTGGLAKPLAISRS
jgi:hypothetical protein